MNRLRAAAQKLINEAIPQKLDELTEWEDWTAVSKDGFNTLVEALDMNGWIPVDTLPEENGWYPIGYVEDDTFHFDLCYFGGYFDWTANGDFPQYWRPVPEPPTADSMNGWKLVSELPATQGVKLIGWFDEGGNFIVDAKKYSKVYGFEEGYDAAPTHWREFPEPPGEWRDE